MSMTRDPALYDDLLDMLAAPSDARRVLAYQLSPSRHAHPGRRGVVPELIPRRLPHLSLAQVFDVLSLYSDRQAEINAHIERNCIPDAAFQITRRGVQLPGRTG